ncbi:MAG: hypothetical protein IEMM0008_0231 [bacterium]|nr:MAG: hypothetical protein IEMM0008_0231 [bacterium]
MNRKSLLFVSLILSILYVTQGCLSQDIPQAHKGRMFDKTGALILFVGGHGFTGPVLDPGTYWIGLYDDVLMVDCKDETKKETLPSLTRDGVQFNVDVYVRYSANSEEESIKLILNRLTPDRGKIISSDQLWRVYVRPALGEAVRQAISQYDANDINIKRQDILKEARDVLLSKVRGKKAKTSHINVVTIKEFNISNLGFPKDLIAVNTERAKERMLRDKAIAARGRVEAEMATKRKAIEEQTKNAIKRLELRKREGMAEAARIDLVGAALRRNPQYAALKMYETAASKGNMILMPSGQRLNILIPQK